MEWLINKGASIASSVFYLAVAFWATNTYVLGEVPGPAETWYTYGVAALALIALTFCAKAVGDFAIDVCRYGVSKAAGTAKTIATKAADTLSSTAK